MRAKRVLLSWSSGKDCAWALQALRQQPDVEVVALVTTFNQAADRVAMHAVRRQLVRQQAELVSLPLWEVELPWPCSNQIYEDLMKGVCQRAVSENIEAFAFGDLFLEDVRAYRERQLQDTGLQPLFPLWGIPTGQLASQMMAGGAKAKLTCLDPAQLDERFIGCEWNEDFLAQLPPGVDCCGEKGEFHTFCYDGPCFRCALKVETGEIVKRDGFVFADVL